MYKVYLFRLVPTEETRGGRTGGVRHDRRNPAPPRREHAPADTV